MKKIITLLVLTACLTFLLSSCMGILKKVITNGETETETVTVTETNKVTESEKNVEAAVDPKLQLYIDASMPSVRSAMEQYKDTFDLTVTGEGTTLVYMYKYVFDVGDIKAVYSGIKLQEDTLITTAKTIVIPEMKSYGIKDPKIKYVYLNVDGTEIYSHLIEDN